MKGAGSSRLLGLLLALPPSHPLLLLSSSLDRANRCAPLPSAPPLVRIHLSPSPRLAAGLVGLQLTDGPTTRCVAAPAALALHPRCRALVRELGHPSRLLLPSPLPPLASWRLQRAFCRRLEPPPPPPAEEEEGGWCDVLFTRRGAAPRAAAACSAAWRAARRVPWLGARLAAAAAAAAAAARAALTPAQPPPLALRLVGRMPWRVKRLAARVWVQSCLTPSREGAEEGSPLLRVLPMRMLDAAQCDEAVAEAEAYARENEGWLTSRHIAFPTTDIPISRLPRLQAEWEARLFPRLAAAVGGVLGLDAERGERLVPLDVFVVKYAHDGQRELAVHRDNGLLTFSLLLNDPGDFEGGGTYFEESGRVYRPSKGVGVVHSALVRHAGFPITSGTRYVLVGFCGLESPRLPAGFAAWRFGEPSWFVSSRVVSDRQLTSRIWPASHAAAAPPRAMGADDSLAAVAAAAESAGDKAWYFKQHKACVQARGAAALVRRVEAGGGEAHEFWLDGDDLVGLAVRRGADGAEAVLASVLYREGPVAADTRRALQRLLPPPRRLRSRVRALLRRERLSGMVHVYVVPAERGARIGEELVRATSAQLFRMGVSHHLTLADDSGSGKLRAWYRSLGFVDAPGLIGMETSMVAHTG
ncbi:hypothetical protein AB1Y20_004780 [Prymnesium parvum]|uniref:Fe2OG dioxygenase domain-containing protein n=1 Tax=Prymnesium parvum TaxID=97485 RepID=A0AB34J185_PRYPA